MQFLTNLFVNKGEHEKPVSNSKDVTESLDSLLFAIGLELVWGHQCPIHENTHYTFFEVAED